MLDMSVLTTRTIRACKVSAVPWSYSWTTAGIYVGKRHPSELLATGRENHDRWRRTLLRLAGRGYWCFLVYLGDLQFAHIDLDPYTYDVWCVMWDYHTCDAPPARLTGRPRGYVPAYATSPDK